MPWSAYYLLEPMIRPQLILASTNSTTHQCFRHMTPKRLCLQQLLELAPHHHDPRISCIRAQSEVQFWRKVLGNRVRFLGLRRKPLALANPIACVEYLQSKTCFPFCIIQTYQSHGQLVTLAGFKRDRAVRKAHLMQRNVSKAQNLTVVSYDPETRKVSPTAKASTASPWPSSTLTHSSVSTSQTLIVLSHEPLKRYLPP